MFSKTTKTMLKNVIQHTGTHNRMVEEADMWSQRDLKRHDSPRGRSSRMDKDSRNSFLFDQRSDYYDDRRSRHQRSAHMDSDSDREDRKSTYWARQLQKAEEADPERWGHSGFKELYPDHFDSDRSDSEDERRRHKSKKRHERSRRLHSDENEDDRRHRKKRKKTKDKKSKKKKKEKKKKSKHVSSDSDSESERRHIRVENETFRTKSENVVSEFPNEGAAVKRPFLDEQRGKRKFDSSTDSESESSESNMFRQPVQDRKKRKKHKHDKLRENGSEHDARHRLSSRDSKKRRKSR